MTYLGCTAVITRTKNRPILLERAIKSVLCQSIDDWFMVIVNDGGDPAPVDELVSRYKDQFNGRVGIIHNPESLGMEAASNRGIAYGDSKYLIIHDDDDSWAPNFLESSINELKKQQQKASSIRGIVCHATCVIEHIEENEVIIDDMYPFKENPDGGIIGIFQIAAGNLFPPISFLYERSILKDIGGGYSEKLPVLGDWEFNLRFISKYDIYCTAEPYSFYHHRPKAQGILSNTVSDSKVHGYYTRYIQNELLRADLRTGKMGLGVVVSLTERLKRMEESMHWAFSQTIQHKNARGISRNLSFGSLRGFISGFTRSAKKGTLVKEFFSKFFRNPVYAFKVLFSYGNYASRDRKK